jgi:acyl-CoA synthetase (AMP-forming)/AMP-acid ligase II
VTDVRTGRCLSYEALGHEADGVSTFLKSRGVERGHRIALLCPNNLAYVPAAFGLLAAGACVVPVPVNLAPAEMAQLLGDIDVNGCFASPGLESVGEAAAPALARGECEGFSFQWRDRDAPGPAGLRALDPAFIRFTSGTTAQCKGVVISHAATAARVQAADAVLRFTPDDRILWVLPLAYHFAVTIVAYVKAGAHILMCPDTLPHTIVDSMRSLAATVLYASPFHFERLGRLQRSDRLQGVRLALSTSAPISAAVMERFESAYGIPVAQAYGIIEAGLPCINVRNGASSATSVGRPVPGYDVSVFNDAGAPLRAGEPGEIGVRGAGLFSAYYAPWQPRESITRDGWFLTGDIGRIDAGGSLQLEGRKKSVIFVAGVKFFPDEVEACINAFAGVMESRVIGDPHPRLGQVPRAEVVLADDGCDLDALKAHCARALSTYKVPLQFTVVAAIARTPGGKILRRSECGASTGPDLDGGLDGSSSPPTPGSAPANPARAWV